jgi:ASC-1-like (ASCH) protein
MIHELKIIPEYFQAIWDGKKPFEVRKNDRNYQVGDTVQLNEFDPKHQQYTGGCLYRTITYVLDNPDYVKDGFVIFGLGEKRP